MSPPPTWRRALGRLGRLARRAAAWPARRAARRRFALAAPARVLVADLGGLGNLLMSTPLLAALRAGWPRSFVQVLVSTLQARELLQPAGLADRLDVVPVRPPRLLPDEGELRAAAAAAGGRHDLLVVAPVHGVEFFQGLAGRLGIPFAAGEDLGLAGHGYTHPAPCRLKDHEVERGLAIARALGLAPAGREYRLGLTAGERRRAAELLAQAAPGAPEGRLVACHPGGGLGGGDKRWPADRFGEVAAALAREGWGPFLVLGGPEEAELARAVAAAASGAPVIDLAGRTAIREAAALLERARLMVTNDTGLMHLAVAAGAPVVAVFGPTDPAKNGPRGPRDRVVRAPCPRGLAPCYPRPAADCAAACLAGLPAVSVLAACREVLKGG